MTGSQARRRDVRQALALVVVVYVLAALSTLAFALAFRSRLGLYHAQLLIDRVQQDEIALAACAQACRFLTMDDPGVDSFADAWAGWHAMKAPLSPRDADGATWQVWWQLEDESAKINIRLAAPDMLAKIEGLDEAVVASIRDWIDRDDVPNPGGAENEYYASQSPAYGCRNGPPETLEELAFIKGITPEIYFGTGTQGRIEDWNEPTAARARGDDEEGQAGLNELLTIYGNGRINLNTVLPAVLKAIPFLSDAAQSEILSRQQAGATKFTRLEDIRSDTTFTSVDKTVLLQVARFNSSHFQFRVGIRSAGSSTLHEYVAILERDKEAIRILNWQRRLPRVPWDDPCEAFNLNGYVTLRH